jgi:AraC family ethanolamine operon transcriptional activator
VEGPVHHVAELPDFDSIADMGTGLGWEIDFRLLGSGKGTGRVEAIATGRTLIQRNRLGWHLHQRGASPSGSRTFGIAESTAVPIGWLGRRLVGPWMISFPSSAGFESVSHPSFDAWSVSFDDSLLTETASALGVPEAALLTPGGTFEIGTPALNPIRTALRHISAVTGSDPTPAQRRRLLQAIETDLLTAILSTLAGARPTRTPRVRLRDRALRRCVEFVEESGLPHVTVRELCEVSGVSERTLEYAFREHFRVTPSAYLQIRRLNRVRSELRDTEAAPGVIAEIAGRWGFWHMGDFARYYSRLFGKLPSETLRTGRGRTAALPAPLLTGWGGAEQ